MKILKRQNHKNIPILLSTTSQLDMQKEHFVCKYTKNISKNQIRLTFLHLELNLMTHKKTLVLTEFLSLSVKSKSPNSNHD